MKKLMIFSAALAATALSLPATVCAAPLPAAESAAPTRFNVEVTGQGPDLILIPGLSTSRGVWDATVADFKGQYRIHTVEVAGFGHDAGPNAEGEILPGLVDELAAYIEANGLKSPTVVGHSMGGFTALNLSLDHPELVGKLVIVDSLPFFSVLFNPQATAESAKGQASAMRSFLISQADTPVPEADCANPSPTAQGMSNTPEGQCRIDQLTLPADRRVAGQLLYELMTTDLRERVADLKVPTAMLYPYDEPAPSKAMADAVYGGAYGSAEAVTLVPIADSRHFIMLDQPEAFHAALADFLAR